MTPAQRLMLSARQASEQAQRLLAWLQGGKSGRPEIASLVDEVEGIAGAIGRIVDAVDRPPVIAIVGGHGSGKTALLAALSGAPDRALRAEFPNREASLDVLSSIIPHRSGAQTSAAVRLTKSELPQAPRGFPVVVRLLGQLDVIKLLFRAHAGHIGVDPARVTSARSVAALFYEAERHLLPRAVAGLSARDVADLREDLNGFDPRSPLLRGLAAAGYWDRLAVVVAHLPETERTRLISLLWNEEPILTALYSLLAGAIEKLGHASEVFCELAAIVTREPATGWMVPHRTSIVAAETLAGLVHALGPVPLSTVQVSGRFGGSVAIDRAVLAVLAAELPLTLQSAPVEGLAETDIVMLPAASPLADVVRPDDASMEDGTGELRGGLGVEAAVAIVAHAKSAFLVERAARRHGMTSLVVCVDPAEPPDDALAGAIGDWVDITQGADPHNRERMRTALFVAISRPLEAGETAVRLEPWREAGRDPDVRRWLEEGIGVDHDWPEEWTRDHSFENYFAFHRPERTATGHRPGEIQLRLVPSDSSATPPQPKGGSGSFAGAISAVATTAKKHRQLGLALAEQRRRLRSRVLRHHLSNDPLEIAEWRRQVANVAINKLRRAAQGSAAPGSGAARLVAALSVTEAELSAVIDGVLRQDAESADSPPDERALAISGAAPENPSFRHDSASAAITYWMRAMRQAGRSRRFCRHLGVPQTVLQHVIDEIAIGAARTGLLAELTAAYARLPAAVASGDRLTGHLAATGARIVNAYLADIARPVPAAASEALLDPPARRALERSAGAGDRDRSGFGGAGWTDSIARLVEANIAAASGLVEASERDRELGELLTGFASSPFEVEL